MGGIFRELVAMWPYLALMVVELVAGAVISILAVTHLGVGHSLPIVVMAVVIAQTLYVVRVDPWERYDHA